MARAIPERTDEASLDLIGALWDNTEVFHELQSCGKDSRQFRSAGRPILRMPETPPNLILIGFMATGKTTIGRLCATALNFRFRDSDTLVERRAKRSVSYLFAHLGEEVFRHMEREAIRDLCRGSRVVIATGGGVPLFSENVAHMRKHGVVILLTLSEEEIFRRVVNRNTRPLLNQTEDPLKRIHDLLSYRDPLYRQAADVSVDTCGLCCKETAEMVLNAYAACAAKISWTYEHRRPSRKEP